MEKKQLKLLLFYFAGNVAYKSFQYKDVIEDLQFPSNSEVSLKEKYLK